MGIKLFVVGIALMIAVSIVLNLIGLSASNVFNQIGAFLVLVGAALFVFNK